MSRNKLLYLLSTALFLMIGNGLGCANKGDAGVVSLAGGGGCDTINCYMNDSSGCSYNAHNTWAPNPASCQMQIGYTTPENCGENAPGSFTYSYCDNNAGTTIGTCTLQSGAYVCGLPASASAATSCVCGFWNCDNCPTPPPSNPLASADL